MTDDSFNEFKANIKVVGVGGAGCNAIDTMIESGIQGVDFIAVNTDAQVLKKCKALSKLQIGQKLTKGLGAGADPELGKKAAEEDKEKIKEALKGADMVFITAGMGGGTGTGASPVIAEICKNDLDILSVAVSTKPFFFEGKKRLENAQRGIEEIKKFIDTLIIIPNDKLLSLCGRNIQVREGFKKADEVLMRSVRAITDVITTPSLINIDFADVKSVMKDKKIGLIGIGESEGENRAQEAAEKAAVNQLLEDGITINGATDVLLCIAGGNSLTLHEVKEAATFVQEKICEEANVKFGVTIRDELGERVQVAIVATGLGEKPYVKKREETPLEMRKRNELFVDMDTPGKDIYDIPTFIRKARRR